MARISGDGRPSRVQGSGPAAQAFQQVLDQGQAYELQAISSLRLSFYGSSKSHADGLTALGLAIP